MTDSEATTTTTTTTTNDVIRIATSFKPKNESDSGGSGVSFDSSNLLLLKKYHDFEELFIFMSFISAHRCIAD